jgi:hypothetical protein
MIIYVMLGVIITIVIGNSSAISAPKIRKICDAHITSYCV